MHAICMYVYYTTVCTIHLHCACQCTTYLHCALYMLIYNYRFAACSQLLIAINVTLAIQYSALQLGRPSLALVEAEAAV